MTARERATTFADERLRHAMEWGDLVSFLEQAIEAAILEEREACAKLADEFYDRDGRVDSDTAVWKMGDLICEAIRKRGQS